MYRIFDNDSGDTIGYTENVNYIKIGDSGCFTNATEDDAQGLAINSTAYNLFGKEAMENVETTVGIVEFDGAALIAEQESVINDLLISSLEG